MVIILTVVGTSQEAPTSTKWWEHVTPQFTDDNAACMVINEQTFAMLLTEARFKDFTNKDIIDASKNIEVLVGFSAESREQVDDVVNKAFDAGGSPASETKDYGFMYQASFMDLDGHVWEVIYMDMGAVQ